MGCLEEGCRGFLPPPPRQDQESTLFLFTPCLWLEGVTSTAPVYPSSPPLLLHPHIALILGNATHMAKEAATQASRSQATASGIPPDHSPRWEGWIQMKSFSVKPTKEKGIWAERSGWAKCMHKCVRACVSVSADRQELWQNEACVPGCQLAG